MTESLAEKTCTPCRGGVQPLPRDEALRFQAQALIGSCAMMPAASSAYFDSAISQMTLAEAFPSRSALAAALVPCG